MKKSYLAISIFILSLFPFSLFSQEAEDIIMSEGYVVEKIAETNKAPDPMGLTFDSSGNLIVTNRNFSVLKVDPYGNVELIVYARKFNINPFDIEIAFDGSYILLADGDAAIGEGTGIYKFTPPNDFSLLISGYIFNSIAYDKKGNFYASYSDDVFPYGAVAKYDSDFNEIDTIISGLKDPFEMVFDNSNNMYLVEKATHGTGKIWKITAGENGVPGPEDQATILISNLRNSRFMTIDDTDYIYLADFSHSFINGFSKYLLYNILKVNSHTGEAEILAYNFHLPWGLVYRDNFVYVSEFWRGVISKINIFTKDVSDFTTDYGITYPGPIGFDSNDKLYTHGFRDQKLVRLNNNGTFDQVGEGTGICQTIISDGAYFFLGSLDQRGINGYQILKIDPIAETMEIIGTHYNGFRSIAYDSFDRLILNTSLGNGDFGLDIIDLDSGESTPYIIGMHNTGRCIQFDDNQNVFFKEGVGDGIKKVWLEKDYDPPRDVSSEPLFFDFTYQPYPPSIGFFHVNKNEEIFMPTVEMGQILKGDELGNIEVFAEGFLNPWQINSDRYGNLYVSDNGNGIFKISPLIEVDIDIKPGSDPNTINLGSNGNVPIAIFSTAEFDATTVDPLTVTLAGAEVKVKGKGTAMSSIEDINGDGLPDLVVHVDTTALELSGEDTEAVLEGETFDRQKIRGKDTVRIVQE